MQRAAELQLPMPGAMRLVLLDNDITGIELAWSACGTEDVGKVSDAAADSGSHPSSPPFNICPSQAPLWFHAAVTYNFGVRCREGDLASCRDGGQGVGAPQS
ncbi:hypothetical protein SNOG_02895 [Parastagonospora nodorum SN15]|uniref:Uncharacterized protein n=1 Tax=Phaeosphaeria nodorum (strain SN15 / ATCC MYA-4574 / FGSC 10173) TaxID=321614 RepID=Q0UZB9_PHANO|nr:hypothetical protein SNOG_02895 [Parastagonospora nodorum SN15]EAT89626.1 hypothetical protein SNOG_02895 [Parastagonospora nodorum SN15]